MKDSNGNQLTIDRQTLRLTDDTGYHSCFLFTPKQAAWLVQQIQQQIPKVYWTNVYHDDEGQIGFGTACESAEEALRIRGCTGYIKTVTVEV